MSRTASCNHSAAPRSTAARCPGPFDCPGLTPARWPAHSRWHDFDSDDPYDPPMDDEDYEDFRWEEIPDGRAFPPDEFWDDDDCD